MSGVKMIWFCVCVCVGGGGGGVEVKVLGAKQFGWQILNKV